MSDNRWQDVRVERSAVLAVERSILDMTGLITADPVSDFGIDLLAFRPAPFAVMPVQVKGASSGLKVMRQYAMSPMVLAYVVDPMGDAPLVSVMTGEDAWNLPLEYVARGGQASDHHPDNPHYRWPSITRLLRVMLEERRAAESRWEMLFEQTAAAHR